ncbi:MAG: FkbM family methyltransferase [Thermoanaerobaculia bacterium]|nr:FkbM family methyltransferase [Thermoanaerobaculia bacterium]
MVQELDVFLREAGSASVLIDVGACHGLFTLSFLTRDSGRKVVAVEPSPRALAVLGQQLELNGAPAVVVVPHALGRTQGTVSMVYEWHHLVRVGAEGPAGEDRGEVVRVEPLDDLCHRLALAPDLMKIDVEGAELEVLAGGEQTLIEHRPVLLLETHPRELGRLGCSVDEVVQFLEERAFQAVDSRRQVCRPWKVVSRSRVSRSCWVPAGPTRQKQ